MLSNILTLTNTFIINYLTLFTSNSISKQFFYRQHQHFLNCNQNSAYFIFFHSFNLFLLTLFIIRFLLILFALCRLDNLPFMNYDLFYHFFASFSNHNDYFFVVVFIFLFMDTFLNELGLYFSPIDTVTWRQYEDLGKVSFN